jgi:hypothetical protein
VAGVVDLTLPNPVEHEAINLSGDSFNVDATETINLSRDSFNVDATETTETINLSDDSINLDDYEDEVDGYVLEWISANIEKKVNYEATMWF